MARCRGCEALREQALYERERYDALLEKYHALRVGGANAPEAIASVEMPEPEMPPALVLAAMQAISPTRDKAYEANWMYWELHKAQAEAHPEAFAEDIIHGAAYEAHRT